MLPALALATAGVTGGGRSSMLRPSPPCAVDVEDWPSAGASLNRIRQIIAVNLPLGLLVVIIGGSGRYWG